MSILSEELNTLPLSLENRYYPALQECAVVRPLRFLGTAGFPDDGNRINDAEKILKQYRFELSGGRD